MSASKQEKAALYNARKSIVLPPKKPVSTSRILSPPSSSVSSTQPQTSKQNSTITSAKKSPALPHTSAAAKQSPTFARKNLVLPPKKTNNNVTFSVLPKSVVDDDKTKSRPKLQTTNTTIKSSTTLNRKLPEAKTLIQPVQKQKEKKEEKKQPQKKVVQNNKNKKSEQQKEADSEADDDYDKYWEIEEEEDADDEQDNSKNSKKKQGKQNKNKNTKIAGHTNQAKRKRPRYEWQDEDNFEEDWDDDIDIGALDLDDFVEESNSDSEHSNQEENKTSIKALKEWSEDEEDGAVDPRNEDWGWNMSETEVEEHAKAKQSKQKATENKDNPKRPATTETTTKKPAVKKSKQKSKKQKIKPNREEDATFDPVIYKLPANWINPRLPVLRPQINYAEQLQAHQKPLRFKVTGIEDVRKEDCIVLLGSTREGVSVSAIVKTFKPHFFVKLPDHWNPKHVSALQTALNAHASVHYGQYTKARDALLASQNGKLEDTGADIEGRDRDRGQDVVLDADYDGRETHQNPDNQNQKSKKRKFQWNNKRKRLEPDQEKLKNASPAPICSPDSGKGMVGYTNKKTDTIKIMCHSPGNFRYYQDVLSNDISKKERNRGREKFQRDQKGNIKPPGIKVDNEQVSFEPYNDRFKMESLFSNLSGIKYYGWVDVTKFKIQTKKSRITRTQVEIECDVNDIKPDDLCLDAAPELICSFDIEAVAIKGNRVIPQAQKKGDLVPCISARYQWTGTDLPPVRVIFAVGTGFPSQLPGVRVQLYSNEKAQIEGWKRYTFDDNDCDVQLGYNNIAYDLPYLMKRAEVLGIKSLADISRFLAEKCKLDKMTRGSRQTGSEAFSIVRVSGRPQFDVARAVRKNYNFDSYTLKSVSQRLLAKKAKVSAAVKYAKLKAKAAAPIDEPESEEDKPPIEPIEQIDLTSEQLATNELAFLQKAFPIERDVHIITPLFMPSSAPSSSSSSSSDDLEKEKAKQDAEEKEKQIKADAKKLEAEIDAAATNKIDLPYELLRHYFVSGPAHRTELWKYCMRDRFVFFLFWCYILHL